MSFTKTLIKDAVKSHSELYCNMEEESMGRLSPAVYIYNLVLIVVGNEYVVEKVDHVSFWGGLSCSKSLKPSE